MGFVNLLAPVLVSITLCLGTHVFLELVRVYEFYFFELHRKCWFRDIGKLFNVQSCFDHKQSI